MKFNGFRVLFNESSWWGCQTQFRNSHSRKYCYVPSCADTLTSFEDQRVGRRTSKDNEIEGSTQQGGLTGAVMDLYDKEGAFLPFRQWYRSNDIVQGVRRLHKLRDFFSYSRCVIKRIVSRCYWCSLSICLSTSASLLLLRGVMWKVC